MKKVSVMVPAYNAEKFLAEALDSILTQDYENLQVVVADDASTDSTASILRDYSHRFPEKIVAIYNARNLGITKNCNLALSRCDGDYIALFAGDDIMLPGKIKRQVDYMEHHAALAFSYHAVEIFQSETGERLSITDQGRSARISTAADVITHMGIPGPMSIMLRRSSLPEGLFNESLSYVSDWLLQFEMALHGGIGFMEGAWCRYRKYGTNNGKDLSSYENEFLAALDYISSQYPEFNRVCELGRSRYFIGRSFREQRSKNKRRFILQAYQLNSKKIYLVLWAATFLPFSARGFEVVKHLYKKNR